MSILLCCGDQRRHGRTISLFLWSFLLSLSLIGTTAYSANGAEDLVASAWRYVVSDGDKPFDHPPLRSLPWVDEKPADLEESVEYRGSKRRYAELCFGTPTSRPVGIVLDVVSATDFDLYVNASRDRNIFPEDRVAGSGRRFRVEIDVQQVAGLNIQSAPRTVIFRIGRAGRSLSYASAGFTEGTIRVGDQLLTARRMDADGNGGMADDGDLIWIDRNADGCWDPFTERFPFAPVLRLGKDRFAVTADWLGLRLSVRRMEGTGGLRLRLAEGEPTTHIAEVNAYLAGRDGSIFRLEGLGSTVTVPVGEYRIYELAVVVEDPAGGSPWSFFFGDGPGDIRGGWHRVERGQTVDVDPFAGMVLAAEVTAERQRRYQPGDILNVQTKLKTAGGLRLNACSRSARWDPACESGARMRLVSAEGEDLDSATVGFT